MAMLVETPLTCAARLMLTGVLNGVVIVAGAVAMGPAGKTVMLTNAGGVESVPPGPCARYVKVSAPAKPTFGRYVIMLPTIDTIVPLVGGVTTATLI